MFGLYDDPRIYDVAREVCHHHGIPWTDPRTGITYPPPREAFTAFGVRPSRERWPGEVAPSTPWPTKAEPTPEIEDDEKPTDEDATDDDEDADEASKDDDAGDDIDGL